MLTILYRKTSLKNDQKELEAIYAAGFSIEVQRTKIRPNDFVIGRYSCVPYYKELEIDINLIGGKLINSFSQHQYVADLKNWVHDLKELTPETWDRLEDLPEEGPFILKGKTYSHKFEWNELMFAQDKKRAIEIYGRLCKDMLIGRDEIYIRKYVPLKTYMIGLKDLPITKEFRFFICKGEILCGGYYWSNYLDELSEIPQVSDVPILFLKEVIQRIGNKITFYVIDVAQKENGEWTVIELNDGQQAGLSCCSVKELYSNLKQVLEK